jgi:hypothetical protein
MMGARVKTTKYRQKAVGKVPFSSVFYCSNPLAAILTRRRTHLFYFITAIITRIPDIVYLFSSQHPEPTWPRSNFLKFTVLEHRNRVQNTSHPELGTAISAFGVIRNNLVVGEVASLWREGGSAVVRFESTVEWDEWFFTTSSVEQTASDDPIRFMLEGSIDGKEWEVVGSSMSALAGRTAVFLHGRFDTSLNRAHRHTFRVLRPTLFGYYIIATLGDLQNTGLLLCGICGRERLGGNIPNVQALLFMTSQLVAAWGAPLANGDRTRLIYLHFAAMQARCQRNRKKKNPFI